jgi:hypothetical protein
MKLTRTPFEAVLSAPIDQLAEARSWLLAARAGDCLTLGPLTSERGPVLIRVTEGRGFWAHWIGEGSLVIDVGVGGLEHFAAAFEFQCEPVSGAHSHFDPPAFPEEPNDESVPLVIAIA